MHQSCRIANRWKSLSKELESNVTYRSLLSVCRLCENGKTETFRKGCDMED